MNIKAFTDLSQSGSYSNLNMNKELFVVQRCWHSGPQQHQPLDYLRLFSNQRDAEEAAYHSAHAWSKYQNPSSEPQVKTLLLPSYPAHNQTGSSYGFIARGSLFWVRSLMATVSDNHHEGYAVLTEGVIGGTGNRNSRRGTEVTTGRVFVGANSRFNALNVCHQIMAQLQNSTSNAYLATLPIGKPHDYTSGEFLKDWPPPVLQPNLLQTSSMTHNQNKRDTAASSSSANLVSDNDEGVEVSCPFEMPAAKRRRFCKMDDPEPSKWQMLREAEDEVMMMNYGVVGEQA